MTILKKNIAIIGSGAWGTALASHLAKLNHNVMIWGVDDKEILEINSKKSNKILPHYKIPKGVRASTSLEAVLNQSSTMIIAVPSHAFRETLIKISRINHSCASLSWATKGFEIDTGKLLHDVVKEELGEELPTAVISGPTFALEVAQGQPSAITIASLDESYCNYMANLISSISLRAYKSNDIIGVEVGGSVKNILAIAAGISDGLGLGANTRAALITRGLSEIIKLGTKLGANKNTFMGLSGMGDLILTCSDDQSRNRRFVIEIAKGCEIEEAKRKIGSTIEGYLAAKATYNIARKANIEMPITNEVYNIIYEGVHPASAIEKLMSRPIISEK
ncbi:MAG: glycerol-3-phosphate dehydrogenase [Gammaproteobacteria bacterium]|nr:glycerol-3-phosphate dehydrogenase [Gammaproteobacteria bacterium]